MRGTARFSSTSRSTGQTGTQSRTSPRALWTFTTALLRPPSHWPAESFEMESPSALLSHDNPGHQSWSLCVGAVPQLEAWQGNTNRRFCLAFNAWLWQGASPHLSSFPLAHFSSARLGESAGQSTRLGPIPGLRERERERPFSFRYDQAPCPCRVTSIAAQPTNRPTTSLVGGLEPLLLGGLTPGRASCLASKHVRGLGAFFSLSLSLSLSLFLSSGSLPLLRR